MAGKFVHIADNAKAPEVEQLTCPQCHGALTLRAKGYTQTLTCPFCDTILDISQNKLQIDGIQKTQDAVQPLIPLGTRGKLHGVTWEVIGFLQREGNYLAQHELKKISHLLDFNDDEEDYSQDIPTYIIWQEYLLFNPYKGFRWLTEQNGHWNYVITLHALPSISARSASFHNVNYQYYESYRAKVLYVLGEFYWRVSKNETTTVTDYVHKNEILTLEQTQDKTAFQTMVSGLSYKPYEDEYPDLQVADTDIKAAKPKDNEEIWCIAEYIEPEVIQTAFQLAEALPDRIGVAFNQPMPYTSALRTTLLCSALGVIALILVEMIFSIINSPVTVMQTQITIPPAVNFALNPTVVPGVPQETIYTTPSFSIGEKMGVFEFAMTAPVMQTWLEIEGNLVNEQTGEGINIDGGVEFYTGYDEGYWSEGKKVDTQTFSRLPKGNYHFSFTANTNSTTPLPLTITMKEGVFSFSNFLFCLFMIILPAIWIVIYFLVFEAKRLSDK